MKKMIVRKWLNRRGHQSTAFLFVECNYDGDDKTFPSIDCVVKIGDCNRQIELDFNSWGSDVKSLRKNNIEKAELLSRTFAEVAEWLREATEKIESK